MLLGIGEAAGLRRPNLVGLIHSPYLTNKRMKSLDTLAVLLVESRDNARRPPILHPQGTAEVLVSNSSATSVSLTAMVNTLEPTTPPIPLMEVLAAETRTRATNSGAEMPRTRVNG